MARGYRKDILDIWCYPYYFWLYHIRAMIDISAAKLQYLLCVGDATFDNRPKACDPGEQATEEPDEGQ